MFHLGAEDTGRLLEWGMFLDSPQDIDSSLIGRIYTADNLMRKWPARYDGFAANENEAHIMLRWFCHAPDFCKSTHDHDLANALEMFAEGAV